MSSRLKRPIEDTELIDFSRRQKRTIRQNCAQLKRIWNTGLVVLVWSQRCLMSGSSLHAFPCVTPYFIPVRGMVESQVMNTARQITVEVPERLLERAQEGSGVGITQTVRTGLRLVAASRTYARLRELRGKVKFSRTAADLKDDR